MVSVTLRANVFNQWAWGTTKWGKTDVKGDAEQGMGEGKKDSVFSPPLQFGSESALVISNQPIKDLQVSLSSWSICSKFDKRSWDQDSSDFAKSFSCPKFEFTFLIDTHPNLEILLLSDPTKP